jgi:hypothetical protein
VPERLKGTRCKRVGSRLRWFESIPVHHFLSPCSPCPAIVAPSLERHKPSEMGAAPSPFLSGAKALKHTISATLSAAAWWRDELQLCGSQARLSAARQSFTGSASPVASAAATILASIASRNLGSTNAKSAVAISRASAIAARASGLNLGIVAPNFALCSTKSSPLAVKSSKDAMKEAPSINFARLCRERCGRLQSPLRPYYSHKRHSGSRVNSAADANTSTALTPSRIETCVAATGASMPLARSSWKVCAIR